MKTRYFLSLSLILAFCASISSSAQNKTELPDWAMGDFVRPKGVNPVISADWSTTFLNPMTNSKIYWQANDTFNPGSAVKDGKVVVIYRSEDKSGVKIGSRTSRLGYAVSKDGL